MASTPFTATRTVAFAPVSGLKAAPWTMIDPRFARLFERDEIAGRSCFILANGYRDGNEHDRNRWIEESEEAFEARLARYDADERWTRLPA